MLVDDTVNAGSALKSTLNDLLTCDIELAGLASLITLGPVMAQMAKHYGVPFFRLASLERSMWRPEECPLCKARTPLSDRLAGLE